MGLGESGTRAEIPAIKVRQWLNMWTDVQFDPKTHRRRPDEYFYIFTIPAPQLRALCGIYRRTTAGGTLRSADLGIQRRHDPSRSDEIREYVQFGYPWSDLGAAKRASGEFNDLRKPGWLPTSIVVNILKRGDPREGRQPAEEDLVEVKDLSDQEAIIQLPSTFTGSGWKPKEITPVEVIDGQHRLWAFEDAKFAKDFGLPVVAFHGLDLSWQAYLFWTINIKPKRINASLAFDLYPLLRTEDWLERFEGHSVYRETRAQELTEALWAHPDSPWHRRINMLGEPGPGPRMVTQAAWVRSLMATYVKKWEGPGVQIGGLFGAPAGQNERVLQWSRPQQAAFLIQVWDYVKETIQSCHDQWAKALREEAPQVTIEGEVDAAFAGPHTLLNTDQGVRGVLYITNDLCYVRADDLELASWIVEDHATAVDEKVVTQSRRSLEKQPVSGFLEKIAKALAKYDWRASSAESLSEEERTLKLAFRGSGGYRELRRLLLKHLSGVTGVVSHAATAVTEALGY